MFLKYNERVARIWFEITSMIFDQTFATQSSIAALLHLLWNKKNSVAQIHDFLVCAYILLIQYCAGV